MVHAFHGNDTFIEFTQGHFVVVSNRTPLDFGGNRTKLFACTIRQLQPFISKVLEQLDDGIFLLHCLDKVIIS